MALVNCPECGKKNVSDMAEACPECGYAIKHYYQKMKEEKERQDKLKAEAEKRLEEERQEKEAEKEKQEQIIKDLEKHLEGGVKNIVIVAAITLFWGGATIWAWNIPCMLLALFFGYLLYMLVSERFRIQTDIELAKISLDCYEREMNKRKAISKAMYEREQKKWDAQPKCPNCGSKNTKRITKTKKVISTAAWGLASSTIGKQYKCNNCKHLW